MALNLQNDSHRRYNPLTGEWIQVSPHRTKRPWQGKNEDSAKDNRPQYDSKCYLCPGNDRAGGAATNPKYEDVFVFKNDFSALQPEAPDASINEDDLLIAQGEQGICKVICFSPRHDLTLPEMETSKIRHVVDTWISEYDKLGQLDYVNYVQIFENKGAIMGCSNPHPHGQIWAQKTIPEEPAKELIQQEKYYKKHGSTLLGDYLAKELKLKERILIENDHFVALIPFWAFWPFETMIISKRTFGRFTDMTNSEKDGLADIIKRLTIKYDNIFEISFPYSAGFHPAPTDGKLHPEWHFHMHFYPPLLRSATVKKFSVGYEMLGNLQRDISAEKAADLINSVSDIHYKKQ